MNAAAGELQRIARDAKARVRLAELVGRRVDLKRKGGEHLGLCPFHAEKTPSFTVVERKGFYHCFGCGAHGDAIGWLMAIDGLGFADAVAVLAAEAGIEVPATSLPARARLPGPAGGAGAGKTPRLVPRETEAEAAADRDRKIRRARELWAGCVPAAGTPAESYLRARGIDVARLGGMPPTIRFHAALHHRETGRVLPAMVAAIQAPDGTVCGVHRTYLSADGTGKADVPSAKMMFGIAWQGATRLAAAGPVLGVAEGIETGLSVMLASLGGGGAGGAGSGQKALPVWAALSLGNMAGSGDASQRGHRHPERDGVRLPARAPDMDRPGIVLPSHVEELVLIADGDSGDPLSADCLLTRAAVRARREGRRVRILRPPAGTDFNDVLRGAA